MHENTDHAQHAVIEEPGHLGKAGYWESIDYKLMVQYIADPRDSSKTIRRIANMDRQIFATVYRDGKQKQWTTLMEPFPNKMTPTVLYSMMIFYSKINSASSKLPERPKYDGKTQAGIEISYGKPYNPQVEYASAEEFYKLRQNFIARLQAHDFSNNSMLALKIVAPWMVMSLIPRDNTIPISRWTPANGLVAIVSNQDLSSHMATLMNRITNCRVPMQPLRKALSDAYTIS